MTVLVDVDWLSIVVVFWSNVYADDCAWYDLLSLDVNGVFVLLVVESLQMSLDLGEGLVFLVLSHGLYYSVVEVNLVVAEVGDEIANINLLNADAGYDNVVVLVGGEGLLVVVEQFDDLAVQLVEHGVTDSSLAELKSGWAVFVDVVEFRSVAQKLSGDVLEASVVTGVDAAASSLDQFTEDVETLRLVKGEESTLGSDDVSKLDGVKDSLLKSADELDEFVVVVSGGDVVVLITAWEIDTVGITEVGLVGSFNVLVVVVEFLDGSKSLSKTLKVVTGEQLLVDVVETGTVT